MTKKTACPFCGSPHPENTKYCPNTGKNLLEPSQRAQVTLWKDKLKHFLKHSLWKLPIWQFVGIVVGIVAIWATYDVFHKTQQFKDLQIVTLADTSLVEIKNDVYSDIKISYKDRGINNLSLLQLKVESIGTEPILIVDYIQPISISFPRKAEIIESIIIDSEPRNINAQVIVENNSVSIKPLLLNPGDRFVIKLIVANIPPLCPPDTYTWDNIESIPRTPYAEFPTPAPPSQSRIDDCVTERFEIQARIAGISNISTVNTIYERKSITQDITVRFVILYSLAIFLLASIKLMKEQVDLLDSLWSAIKMIVVGLLISIVAYGVLWLMGSF